MTRPADCADVHLFGPLLVRCTDESGRRVTLDARSFGGRKPRQLFQHLLLAGGRVVSTESLAAVLWDDGAPADPAATLQHYVSVLRRQLRRGTSWLPDVVVRERSGYRLDLRQLRLDVHAFDEVADRVAGLAPGSLAGPEDRAELDCALGLVTGDLLSDEPGGPCLDVARQRYRARYAQLALTACGAALAARDAPRVVVLSRLVLDRSPASEPHCVMLMTALSLLGDRAGALSAYEGCASHLVEQLGVDPLPRTRAVRDAVRDGAHPPTLLQLALDPRGPVAPPRVDAVLVPA